jgi:hypothetical protein
MAVGLQFKGFDKFKKKLDPKKFKRRMKKHIGKATGQNAPIAERAVKSAISRGRVEPNTPNVGLTVAMKDSNKPLIDSGQLVKAITSEKKSWDVALVGILNNKTVSDRAGKKRQILTIARALHDGATVSVTDKMRRFFFWMAFANESPFKGKVKPLKPSTKIIRIPARPFLKIAMAKRNIKKYTDRWQTAVGKVMQGKN